MDLLMLVIVIAAVGFCIWLITTKVPMPPYWATIIQVVAGVILVMWVLTRVLNLPNVLR